MYTLYNMYKINKMNNMNNRFFYLIDPIMDVWYDQTRVWFVSPAPQSTSLVCYTRSRQAVCCLSSRHGRWCVSALLAFTLTTSAYRTNSRRVCWPPPTCCLGTSLSGTLFRLLTLTTSNQDHNLYVTVYSSHYEKCSPHLMPFHGIWVCT